MSVVAETGDPQSEGANKTSQARLVNTRFHLKAREQSGRTIEEDLQHQGGAFIHICENTFTLMC